VKEGHSNRPAVAAEATVVAGAGEIVELYHARAFSTLH